ncbi:GlcG/HbpS family heme-binding protein [Rhodococcus qingshengii]|uniref:GlcG/HbpS family heme-binding protein n=1 Tax=Rhodococcus TaxID=1827 RepID=UPI001BAF28D9|nr:heme-binding protein [Rhodococcus qingshengii]MBS3694147.1 heme-binding protein [Rhodococcus qingshengii]
MSSFETRSRRAVDAVVAASASRGIAVSVAVVDASGILQEFRRMDGSVAGPVDVSQKKARTAALFGMDGVDFAEVAQPGAAIYSIENTNGGLISFGGSVVLRDSGRIVGGIGVAGATVDADEELARIGTAAF